MRIPVLGIPFDNITMSEAVSAAMSLIDGGAPSYIVTPNAEIVYECRTDTELRGIICNAGLIVPDGAGVVLGAKMLKTPLKQKVAGIELAAELAKELARCGKSLFLLGAKPGIAELAASKLCELAPGLIIAGYMDGYFSDDTAAAAAVKASCADVLYVGLGSPRQELWIDKHLAASGARLAIGLGGSFDIYAGTLNRAPPWMVSASLEWLYRLLKQPSRLGRMMRLPKFVWAVYKSKR